jgi:hypothetical protein
MPGFQTHYFFGQEMLPLYSPEISSTIKKHPNAYHVGLEGPDVFFYSIPAYFSGTKNIGNLMHSFGTWAFFDACLTYRNRCKSLESKRIIDAYIMGLLCHYTLDSICHPYIYYRTKHMEHLDRETYDFGIHVFLETDIDNALIRHFEHVEPNQFDSWNIIKLSDREYTTIRDFLYHVLHMAYPEEDISKFLIGNALKSMPIGQLLLNDKTAQKKKVVRAIEGKLFGHAIISSMIPGDHFQKYTDPLNLNHHVWKNPWNPSDSSHADVFELFNMAKTVMSKRSNLYHKPLALLEDISDCSYLSGLPL